MQITEMFSDITKYIRVWLFFCKINAELVTALLVIKLNDDDTEDSPSLPLTNQNWGCQLIARHSFVIWREGELSSLSQEGKLCANQHFY